MRCVQGVTSRSASIRHSTSASSRGMLCTSCGQSALGPGWPSRHGAAIFRAIWDRCIIEQGLPGNSYSLARDLLREVTDQDRKISRASIPVDWANEFFAIAVSPEFRYCVRSQTDCWYAADNARLDEREPQKTIVVDGAYIDTHTPVVRDRLVKAGVRLGGLLNRALGASASTSEKPSGEVADDPARQR